MLVLRHRPTLLRLIIALGLIAAIIGVWWLTPLADYTDPARLAAAAIRLRGTDWTTPIVLAMFVVGGLVFLPLTALVVATALTFGAVEAFLLCTAGSLLNAMAGFLVGHFLGAAPLRRLTGGIVERLSNGARRHGILLVTTLRLMPVAHFSVTNLASGASSIRVRDFLVGTVLGCVPGILAITAAGSQLRRFVTDPDIHSFLLLAAFAGAGLALFQVVRWRVRRYAAADLRESKADTTPD